MKKFRIKKVYDVCQNVHHLNTKKKTFAFLSEQNPNNVTVGVKF